MKNTTNSLYTKLIICYFSGTGNARFAAHTLISHAREFGMETELINIGTSSGYFPKLSKNTLVGFCYPTHGFNAPPLVLNYIAQFPKGDSDVFVLNTRAGLKLRAIHIPGISGMAVWLPAAILKIKGYGKFSFLPLDLPSNWISLHPGLNKNAISFIVNRCSKTLTSFGNSVLTGKRIKKGLFGIPIDIALIPITVSYYFYGRFALAKTFFANYTCNNCGKCINNCPVQAITMKSNRPFWKLNCESCMKCMNECPTRSIETAHTLTLAIWWLAFSLLPIAVIDYLSRTESFISKVFEQIPAPFFKLTLLGIGILIILFGYQIFHQLLRIPVFNKIITFTSPTHFRFWRRYGGPGE